MVSAARWQQSPLFDPTNAGQMIQEHYTGLPGGYSSMYFNRIPTDASLAGLGAATVDWYQLGAALAGVAVVATIGLLGWKQRDLIKKWRTSR